VDSAEAARLHELLMDLVRAAGLLQPDQTVAGHPVSLSQAFVLHQLDTGTPLSQRDLAERLRLEKSSVSRLVSALEREGLLVRERDPDNHRQYECWVEAMTPGERAALLEGLPALIRVIRQHQP
jgi:DNA-binding MarR family transcriptional regulator